VFQSLNTTLLLAASSFSGAAIEFNAIDSDYLIETRIEFNEDSVHGARHKFPLFMNISFLLLSLLFPPLSFSSLLLLFIYLSCIVFFSFFLLLLLLLLFGLFLLRCCCCCC